MKSEKRKILGPLSRRDFLRTAGVVGAGLVAGACAPQPTEAPTEAPKPTEAPTEAPKPTEAPVVVEPPKEGLAEGMIGGPTGFEGAERYQYGPDSVAGRAMEALKSLPADKKPEKIVMQLADGALGHFDAPFPEGAPPVREIFTEESGIELDIVGISPDDQFTKIIQETTTKAGQFDVYSFWGPDRGTLAQAGSLLAVDEFIGKYKPEWEKYYDGGESNVQQFNVYAGKTVAISLDGDYQIWIYRNDLFEDPKEQKAFEDKYGWYLQWPETWDQLAQISEFFTRPDEGLYGCTDIRNRYWGYTNWYQRYASGADPYMQYFDPDTAKPLIDGEAGIRAAQEYTDTLAYHSPDAITWGWPEQYANFAAGGAAVTCAFPNLPKFLDNPDNPDSKIVGKIRSGLSPGRIFGDKLIRRAVWWPNITFGVSPQSKYPEATYLLLQWLGSPPVFNWMVGNPAGYFDPFQSTNFEDPVVVASYHEYHIPVYRDTIKHSVPPININGTNEYTNTLDENLQAVMTGQKTAEEAMKDTAADWEEITDRLGRDDQIEALQAEAVAWPTVADAPTIET